MVDRKHCSVTLSNDRINNIFFTQKILIKVTEAPAETEVKLLLENIFNRRRRELKIDIAR